MLTPDVPASVVPVAFSRMASAHGLAETVPRFRVGRGLLGQRGHIPNRGFGSEYAGNRSGHILRRRESEKLAGDALLIAVDRAPTRLCGVGDGVRGFRRAGEFGVQFRRQCGAAVRRPSVAFDWRPVPRQQVGEPCLRRVCDPGDSVGEPGPGIDVVELGGLCRPPNYAELGRFPQISC